MASVVASSSALTMNLVFTGNLYWARRMACLAKASLISGPPISKRIRPGLTTATQNSGLPLPEPIRVSAARMVTGLSGKIRIQIFPPRLVRRLMARRLASICRAVTQPHSWAWRANEPKAMVLPLVAMPRMRPRCCLRNLTRRGLSMV